MSAVAGNDIVCGITAFLTTAYVIFATNEPQRCCIRQGENLTLYNIHLPIPSLEKYLKAKLFDQVDKALTQELDNYIFQKVGLRNVLLKYKNKGPYPKNDSNGKELFDALSVELASNGKSREELVNIIFRFINEHDSQRTSKILSFLQKQL